MMVFFALLTTAQAGELKRSIAVVNSDGIEDAQLDAVLSPDLFDACVNDAISYLSFQVEAMASEGALELTWQTAAPEGSPLDAQVCLEGQLREVLSPVLASGERALLHLQLGEPGDLGSLVGATGTMHTVSPEPATLSPQEAASGLSVSVATAEGIDSTTLEAGISGQRSLIGDCYAGPAAGGRVSLLVDWTRKEQHLKLTSYTSHMQETGTCIEGALNALAVRELDNAGRSGKATFELRFKPPE